MSKAKITDNTQGLAGLLSVVMVQAQVIQSADNATDSKANNLMAASFVIIALLATQLRDAAGDWRYLAIASMALEVLVVGLVMYLTRERNYYGALVDIDEHKEYFTLNDSLLLAQLVEDANFANGHNEQILGDKQKLYRISIFIFLAGFVLGLVSLFIAV